MIKKCICKLFFCCVFIFNVITISPLTVCAEEVISLTDIITETERNPEVGDTSKWLTITPSDGEVGIRIVSNDGKEIIAIDNYGGIYINGDIYTNGKVVSNNNDGDEKKDNQIHLENGFLYFGLLINFLLLIYLFAKLLRQKSK